MKGLYHGSNIFVAFEVVASLRYRGLGVFPTSTKVEAPIRKHTPHCIKIHFTLFIGYLLFSN